MATVAAWAAPAQEQPELLGAKNSGSFPFTDDPFKAQATGVLEYQCSLGFQVLIEVYAVMRATSFAASISASKFWQPPCRPSAPRSQQEKRSLQSNVGQARKKIARVTARAMLRTVSMVMRGIYLIPVLQGYALQDYLNHIDQYGERLAAGAYVGVGSICKRNGDMRQIEAILAAIKRKRPDLRLHGFGLKTTSLARFTPAAWPWKSGIGR